MGLQYSRVFGVLERAAGEQQQLQQDEGEERGNDGQCGVNTQEVYCEGGLDYAKLIAHFGAKELGESLVDRFQRLVAPNQPMHPFLKRGMVFAHKDLELVLDEYEQGIPFYLYTGRGPSAGYIKSPLTLHSF